MLLNKVAFLFACCPILLGACTTVMNPSDFTDERPLLRPERFFAGSTQSIGVQVNRTGDPTRRFTVTGLGKTLPNEEFELKQRVVFDRREVSERTWLLKRTDAHHYTGMLSDTAGTVRAEAYGNIFHIRYPMSSLFGGQMEQWMYLQPDGITVLNEATVRVFGIDVVRLSERITHIE